ncbi:hypothetical protein ILFOPFJJ_01512 [Ensifer psoraleae]|uniref:hypothetical protein n=1 Tax=Sinorhizobium psoraleae TaxID=520838 RepID=UPI001568080F|nr:hypothetical protein [Sinorhizobium psoraleae]NRP70631.1 hypothetical protein [Sinorhizobium psoraleae]
MDIVAANSLDDAGRTTVARRYVDAAESWLRKLIHHQLHAARGASYLTTGGILKKPETEKLKVKIASDPARYAREVDATSFEQTKKIICHVDRWGQHFRPALHSAYPLGREQCELFLDRLIAIRNDLQHGRPCSVRQLEQAICYTNDLSDAVKAFFREQSMARQYDVPMFVRYIDSLGNESRLEGVPTDISTRNIDWRRHGRGDLYPGETLVAEVEVDQTFDRSGYEVSWTLYGYDKHSGTKAVVPIENVHVGEQLELTFEVVSDRDWHRSAGIDDRLTLLFRVLPPS